VSSVSLDLYAGEVLGLVGTNGAGKSSLIKILAGVHTPSSGAVVLDDREVTFADPLAASAHGIETVHQNIADGVVPGMTVAENLALDALADGTIPVWASPKAITARAAVVAGRMELDVDLSAPVESLSASERQQLTIARALSRQPRLLILDEPSSTLSASEVRVLFGLVRRLAASGVSVIYVSHYLHEIEELCDRVAVLRDGRLEGIFEKPFTRAQLIEAMLGELVAVPRPESVEAVGAVVLELSGIRAWVGGDPIDLRFAQGEVVGITGLIGAGKSEVVEQVFGVRPIIDGEIRLHGRPFAPRAPSDAVAARVGFVPEERSKQAIVPGWSVTQNITLPYLNLYSRIVGILDGQAERSIARSVAKRMSLVYAGPGAPIESLSGGNQQKVVVGRWMQTGVDLLILDEPFRGIDVGARADISRELRELAGSCAVIVVTSDPEEILEVADRVVIMAEGRVVGQVRASDVNTKMLAEMMSGGRPR
jgi:simple sugar transport system ATP-binding protein